MKKIVLWIMLVVICVLGFYFVPNRNLNVEPEYQYPSMPNGCEVTSLNMLMKYNGHKVSKENLAKSYLKTSGTSGADPDRAYIGDPFSNSKGFYCYAQPIVDCANGYFKDKGIMNRAKNKTGMTIFGVLNQVIFKKQPVAVWYTIDDKSPEYSGAYYTTDRGEKRPIYSNLHCVVVTGTAWGRINIIDPIKGRRAVNFIEFIKLYTQMGQRALVI